MTQPEALFEDRNLPAEITRLLCFLAVEEGDGVVHAGIARAVCELALRTGDPEAAIQAFAHQLAKTFPDALAEAVSSSDRREQLKEQEAAS